MAKINLTDLEKQQVCTAYVKLGFSGKEVGNMFGISQPQVSVIIRKAGFEGHSKNLTNEQKEMRSKIAIDYKMGVSIEDISEKYIISRNTILQIAEDLELVQTIIEDKLDDTEPVKEPVEEIKENTTTVAEDAAAIPQLVQDQIIQTYMTFGFGMAHTSELYNIMEYIIDEILSTRTGIPRYSFYDHDRLNVDLCKTVAEDAKTMPVERLSSIYCINDNTVNFIVNKFGNGLKLSSEDYFVPVNNPQYKDATTFMPIPDLSDEDKRGRLLEIARLLKFKDQEEKSEEENVLEDIDKSSIYPDTMINQELNISDEDRKRWQYYRTKEAVTKDCLSGNIPPEDKEVSQIINLYHNLGFNVTETSLLIGVSVDRVVEVLTKRSINRFEDVDIEELYIGTNDFVFKTLAHPFSKKIALAKARIVDAYNEELYKLYDKLADEFNCPASAIHAIVKEAMDKYPVAKDILS